MMWWCDGVIMWWCDDAMVWWCDGVMVWWCGDVMMWWCDDVMMWWSHDVMVWWCDDVVMWWCDGVMMWWCDDVMVWWCDGVMMWWCGDVMMWWCDDVMVWWCDDVMVSWCDVMVWWCDVSLDLTRSQASCKLLIAKIFLPILLGWILYVWSIDGCMVNMDVWSIDVYKYTTSRCQVDKALDSRSEGFWFDSQRNHFWKCRANFVSFSGSIHPAVMDNWVKLQD